MLEVINNEFQYIVDYPLARHIYFLQLKRRQEIEDKQLQAVYLCD